MMESGISQQTEAPKVVFNACNYHCEVHCSDVTLGLILKNLQ
jgi:hypothetical protein